MTLDERIEALTMNLELLWKMHEDLEHSHSEAISVMANALFKIDRSFARLNTLVEYHENRISKLENQK